MRVNELIEILRDNENPNVLDYLEEAADALEAQQERINELTTELQNEMHRHDRLQDFEVAEAQQLAEIKAERDSLKAELKCAMGCGGCMHCRGDWRAEPCCTCHQDKDFPEWEWKGTDDNERRIG